ncbi:MAG TPA: phenylalanine 4-monooxygenase, partial [Luteimonas sp.]|nr:phenylalanine 4-monooxygenase [Luteimonas sp.]
MNQPRRLENIQTDRGKIPVYATGIVEQPWDDYTATDHDVWRRLYARQ